MPNNTKIPEISKAVMIIHEMSEDEKVQEIARIREKALHDEATALGHARREGRAEGRQIGMRKGEQIGIKKAKAEMIEAMRRGMKVECVYFHSYPYTSEEAQQKVQDLAKIIAQYGNDTHLNVISFTEVQMKIKQKTPEAYST